MSTRFQVLFWLLGNTAINSADKIPALMGLTSKRGGGGGKKEEGKRSTGQPYRLFHDDEF